ncbi:MAG: HU family DNA-binding protein [Desulfobacteraceae bacterium]|nr:HU family DNA-binding protein [Desulfobacteraceae bacterium]
MTLTKTNLVKGVREEVRLKKRKGEKQQSLFPEFDYEILSQKRATELVDAMFEIIKKSMVKGEGVLITGFGKFQVKFKWARKGRNPQTGENIILDSRRIVSFQYSPKLKDKMNKTKNP